LSKNSQHLIETIENKIKKNSIAQLTSKNIKADITYHKKKYSIFYVIININNESKKFKKMISTIDNSRIDLRKTKQAVKAN
jgi:lipoate-protein ligase B